MYRQILACCVVSSLIGTVLASGNFQEGDKVQMSEFPGERYGSIIGPNGSITGPETPKYDVQAENGDVVTLKENLLVKASVLDNEEEYKSREQEGEKSGTDQSLSPNEEQKSHEEPEVDSQKSEEDYVPEMNDDVTCFRWYDGKPTFNGKVRRTSKFSTEDNIVMVVYDPNKELECHVAVVHIEVQDSESSDETVDQDSEGVRSPSTETVVESEYSESDSVQSLSEPPAEESDDAGALARRLDSSEQSMENNEDPAQPEPTIIDNAIDAVNGYFGWDTDNFPSIGAS